MDRELEKPIFPIVVWTICLGLGALQITESSALSGGALPEPFTRSSVALAQASAGTTTPVPSHHSRGTRVKRYESSLKKFLYEPFGQWLRFETNRKA